ncbi:hypothetical protein [Endozoicomonas sp. 2B-B]
MTGYSDEQNNPVARVVEFWCHYSREAAEWNDSRRVLGASRQCGFL